MADPDTNMAEIWNEKGTLFVACLGLFALLAFLCSSLIKSIKVDWLTPSLVTVLLGGGLGAILWRTGWIGQEESLSIGAFQLFFQFFLTKLALPIIIFESGWTLRRRDFASQLPYILIFAILGTMVAVAIIAALIYATRDLHGVHSVRLALAIAALISSVDPVATLATFGRLNVDPLLFILVFGESTINDAVAITLFEAFNGSDEGLSSPGGLVLTMAKVFFGSIFLGFGLAMVEILVLRFGRFAQHETDAILFILVSSLFVYATGELITESGIITVLFNSIAMGAYAGLHLSPECMSLISFLMKQLASLMDTHIFLFCGVTAVWIITQQGMGIHFGLWVCLFCVVGRVASIVPLGLLSNGIKRVVARRLPAERKHFISPGHLVLMCHAGLRGGVSLVLVLELGDWVCEESNSTDPECSLRRSMVNAVFIVIVVCLLVFGSTTAGVLRCTGLPLGDQVSADATLYTAEDKNGVGWRFLRAVKRDVLTPVLGKPRSIQGASHTLGDAVTEAEERVTRSVTRAESMREPDPPGAAAAERPFSLSLAAIRKRFDLFGTVDPAQVQGVEDALEDRQDALEGSRPAAAGDLQQSDGEVPLRWMPRWLRVMTGSSMKQNRDDTSSSDESTA